MRGRRRRIPEPHEHQRALATRHGCQLVANSAADGGRCPWVVRWLQGKRNRSGQGLKRQAVGRGPQPEPLERTSCADPAITRIGRRAQ